MNETEKRAAVVAEAKTWLKTPYHHMGRVKGAGVDCGQLLAEVYETAGATDHVETGFYPVDWHLHRSEEKYIEAVAAHAREEALPPERIPQPGDIVAFRFGRTISHGAIVVEWPLVIHSYVGLGVIYGDATQAPLAGRLRKVFNPWG